MLLMAVSHCPNDRAPALAGLNCRVSLPMPADRSAFPHRTLQERQVQMRFDREVSSSRPLT